MLSGWTIQRATAFGVASGLAAVLLAAAIGAWPDELLIPYVALLIVTAWCGASILWITLADIRRRGRGGRMRTIRTFDVAIAMLLLLPSAWALRQAWPELGL